MGAPRIRRVESKREMESIKDDFITQGYKIKSEGESTTLMRKDYWGSTGLHILFIFLTAGIGNLIYAYIANNSSEEVLIKLEPAS